MEYLFVGGLWDGRRVEADGRQYLRVAVPVPRETVGAAYDMGLKLTVSSQTYRLDYFRDDEGSYAVYMAVDEVPVDGGMAALIAGYRPSKSDEPEPPKPATPEQIERLVARLEHVKGLRPPEYLRDEA